MVPIWTSNILRAEAAEAKFSKIYQVYKCQFQGYLKEVCHGLEEECWSHMLGVPGSIPGGGIIFFQYFFFPFRFFLTCQALKESCNSHTKIFIGLTNILGLLKLQKNVQNLQALQKCCRSHTKIFTSLTDILGLQQIQKNVQELQAQKESCNSHTKNIYKLDRDSGASTASEKCLEPPGTPEVLQKSYKNIHKLDRHSGASANSEKCSRTSGTKGLL